MQTKTNGNHRQACCRLLYYWEDKSAFSFWFYPSCSPQCCFNLVWGIAEAYIYECQWKGPGMKKPLCSFLLATLGWCQMDLRVPTIAEDGDFSPRTSFSTGSSRVSPTPMNQSVWLSLTPEALQCHTPSLPPLPTQPSGTKWEAGLVELTNLVK